MLCQHEYALSTRVCFVITSEARDLRLLPPIHSGFWAFVITSEARDLRLLPPIRSGFWAFVITSEARESALASAHPLCFLRFCHHERSEGSALCRQQHTV